MIDGSAYQWLLFDADGTLFDYDLAETQALEDTFAELDLPFDERTHSAYRRVNGSLWEDLEKGLISAVALRVRRFELLFEAQRLATDAEIAGAAYLRHLGRAIHLIDDAERVIRTLSTRFRLALVTNGLQDVQRSRLSLSPIGAFFDEVAISEEIGVAKPARGFFDAIFAAMGEPRKEVALMIGDSLTSDIRGGLDYGLDTCWFNPTGRPEDPGCLPRFQIRRLEELLGLLSANGGGGSA